MNDLAGNAVLVPTHVDYSSSLLADAWPLVDTCLHERAHHLADTCLPQAACLLEDAWLHELASHKCLLVAEDQENV